MYTHKSSRWNSCPRFSRNIPGGISEIRKQLPERGGEFEYQIKSISEPHNRVVRESEWPTQQSPGSRVEETDPEGLR
jgi:hypothetical protein